MIHPLVRLLATEPQLLAEHLGAYASLVAQEAGEARGQWTLRVVLSLVSAACGCIAAVLTGVAAMLWFTSPALPAQGSWALCIVPAIPAVLALIAGLWARRPLAQRAFASVQAQVQADLQLLRELTPT